MPTYYERNRERLKERQREYRKKNREKIKEYNARYWEDNHEEVLRHKKTYRETNREKECEYKKSKNGRASNLAHKYRDTDREKGFCTDHNVTTEWIVKNIFNGQKCIYCGDSDWSHLGCDRIDNSKPHTPDNVVCACGVCNMERIDRYTVEEFIEHRKTHPRDLTIKPINGFDVVEINGVKVLKKKEITL